MHNEKIVSHLIVNGFTINPLKNPSLLITFINSLCEIYDKKHICDHGTEIIHENFLGKQIGTPSVSYVSNDSFSGLIGFAVLENGYFVIKIWDNIYPAEIQFDLYLDEKMSDCSIIVDHLSCPPKPFDGMGMFNCTYSLTHSVKNQIFISKYNNKTPMYFVQKPFDEEKYNLEDHEYYLILNELKNIECHFCELQANNLIFIDYPRKIVAVCNKHIDKGSPKELGAKFNEELDIRRIGLNIEKITKIIDGTAVTKNIYKTELDLQ